MNNEQHDSAPLRVAMIGAGIFATESHAPVLKSSPRFTCVAVWSRRLESAIALAKTFGVSCGSYAGQAGFKILLARSDVQAAVMSLPIHVQPSHVLQALQAGKHVLSEKPIAASTSEARQLVEEYHTTFRPKGLVWCVAENFRYEPAWQSAAQAVRDTIGEPLLLSLAMHAPFDPSNKYLQTEWRANPTDWNKQDAGLFVDVFVHGAAGMRLVAGSSPKTASATLTSHASHIPGFDTMVGHVQFANGLQSVVSVTFCSKRGQMELVATGTDGKVVLKRDFDNPGYRVMDGNDAVSFYTFGGIDAEFEAFAELCMHARTVSEADANDSEATGTLLDYNTPDEALADLAFVEALIESGKEGGAVKDVQHQSERQNTHDS